MKVVFKEKDNSQSEEQHSEEIIEDKMTNLTDITIILDNSQLEEDDNTRAQDGEKDFSMPLEPNLDDVKTGKEARDSSLLVNITTTTTEESQLSQPGKDIEKDSTKPISAIPLENNCKEVALNLGAEEQKCEDSNSTFNSSTGEKSVTTQDTAMLRPNSSNLKEKESNEKKKELTVEKLTDDKAKDEGDANIAGVNGETMREVFDILDESKSGHISPGSFGHLIRSLGDVLTSKSASNTVIFRILPN